MKKIKLISFAIAIIMIIGMLAIPASAATWTWRQQKLNDIWYDVETVLGRGSTDAITAAVRDGYYAENGTNCTGSYYYSARENKTYYFGGGVINGRPTDENTGGEKPTGYWDEYGQYWYWDPSSGYYYRIDQWGNKIWGSRSGGSTTGGGTNGANYAGYNYSYSGKNLYAGVITGIDSYVNANQAILLANMLMSSVKSEKDQTKQAGVAWSVLYCMGGPSNLTDQKLRSTYGWYNSSLTSYVDNYGRDLLALAKDVIFRWNAWKNGNTYVGRVLPTNYVYLTYYWNGTTAVAYDKNSNNPYDDNLDLEYYTFPSMLPSSKNELRTPYTSGL